MPKLTLTNVAAADRGIHTEDGFVNFAPGESLAVNLSAGEADDLPAYFSAGDRADDDDAPEGDGLDGLKGAELDALIAAEGVTLPAIGTGKDGRVIVADKVAAIREHREAPAAPPSDGLDEMDDATLRSTVQAITGTEPPADADRAALLALARAA